MSFRTKCGMFMITFLAAAFALIDARGGTIHLQSEDWSAHANFHLVTGLFYTVALCAVIVVLTWIPFRRGELWAWWLIAALAVTIHGGHFVGDFITHGGLRGGGTAQGPGLLFYSLTGVALLLYIIAMILCYPHASRPSRIERESSR